MSNYPNKVMHIFNQKLKELESRLHDEDFVRQAGIDFTRKRKLGFSDIVKSLIFMSSKPLTEELYDYYEYASDIVSASAFVQAREKILPKAFSALFTMINESFLCTSLHKGYHLVAVDGSDLAIPYDPTDIKTYKSNGPNNKGTNLYHINSSYDLLNNRYVDIVINGFQHSAEQESLCTMARRYTQGKAIFIADRNYATWNVMEHLKDAGQHFLIRAKDIDSENGLLKKFKLPNEAFDLEIETILTIKQTSEVRSNPDKYRFLSTSSTFDFISKDKPYHPVKYRAVRFKIEGGEEYETIITNLSREEFSSKEIKELYGMRWGIEVSFRHLKYATGLKVLHAIKRNSIQQEIWARVILYNLSMIIINKASVKLQKTNKKWNYSINITRAIHIIRDMAKRKGGIPPSLESIISKELLPIRPNRKFTRKVRAQSLININYRFS